MAEIGIGKPKIGEWYLPSKNNFHNKPIDEEIIPVQCVSEHNDRYWFTDYQSSAFTFVLPVDYKFDGWTKTDAPK